jgi:hypothetical protein
MTLSIYYAFKVLQRSFVTTDHTVSRNKLTLPHYYLLYYTIAKCGFFSFCRSVLKTALGEPVALNLSCSANRRLRLRRVRDSSTAHWVLRNT